MMKTSVLERKDQRNGHSSSQEGYLSIWNGLGGVTVGTATTKTIRLLYDKVAATDNKGTLVFFIYLAPKGDATTGRTVSIHFPAEVAPAGKQHHII